MFEIVEIEIDCCLLHVLTVITRIPSYSYYYQTSLKIYKQTVPHPNQTINNNNYNNQHMKLI